MANEQNLIKGGAAHKLTVEEASKGGTVLDPFMGSGSTGVACIQEGMRFVGIDMDKHYCEIAENRIGAAQ